MKKTVSTIAIAAGFSLMGVAIAQAGDVTENRDLSAFEKIIIKDTGVSIDVEVGKDYSVTLEGAEKWTARITTEVKGDALVIGRREQKKKSINFNSDNRIMITMPKFTGLEVKGAVDAEISGIDSDRVAFNISGAGNMEVDGRCENLVVDLNGAGNFEGRGLKCKDVEVDISGAGNAEVFATDSVDLEISGFGNIDVYGAPKDVKKDSHMFSNITIHDK